MSAGQRMKYPYTLGGKLAHFPYMHHWRHGRAIRYAVIGLAVCYPLFWKIHQALNSPGNVRVWEDVRRKRLHDHFAAPSDH